MSWIIKAEEGVIQNWFDNLVRTVETQRGDIITGLSGMMADIEQQALETLKTAENEEKREAMVKYMSTNINGVLNKAFSGSAFTDEIERVLVAEEIMGRIESEAGYMNKGEQKE